MKTPLAPVVFASAVAGAGLLGLLSGKLGARRAERRHAPTGRFIGPKGRRLHYVQQGSGPDVILIHGAAVTLGDMSPLLQSLSGAYRVTAFDRPGHGHSDPAPRSASPAEQAAKLHEAALELGVVRPIVVGHSLGGAVALAYGEQFADETAGVVLLAPIVYPGWGPGHTSPALHALPVAGSVLSHTLFALSDPLLMRAAPRMMFLPQKPTDDFRRNVPRSLTSRPVSMRADGVDLLSTSAALGGMSKRYGDYPVPVQIVVGEKDPVLKPARQARRLARELKGAELTVLPGLGHMFHHFEPQAVVKAVGAIRRTSADASAPSSVSLDRAA